MLVVPPSVRRLVVRGLTWSMVVFAVALSPLLASAINPSPAFATPVDCAPVGVEMIGSQLYYVENCFGYNVYRPL